jgi:hypothetical protein
MNELEKLNTKVQFRTDKPKRQDHGVYIGSMPELRGKTALITKQDDEYLTAQFDDMNLGRLAFGQHQFRIDEFEAVIGPHDVLVNDSECAVELPRRRLFERSDNWDVETLEMKTGEIQC